MNKRKFDRLIKALYALSILFAVAVIISLFFLPDIVVVHFGLDSVDYGSKYTDFILILGPVLLTACSDSFVKKKAYLASDEKYQTTNVRRFCWISIIIDIIFYLICVAFLWTQFYYPSTWVTNIFSGFTTSLSFVLNGYTLSLLVIIIGLLIANVKPNLLVGIRNFKLMDNKSLWKHVHKVSSLVFVIAGCISFILCFFVPEGYRLWIPVAILIINSIGIRIYAHNVVKNL